MTDGLQLWLFDLEELNARSTSGKEKAKEKEAEKPARAIPHFENPKTDNQRLLEFQYRFKNGDKSALDKLYTLGCSVALKFINKKAESNIHIRQLSEEERQEKAHRASSYIIERYLKRPDFYIYKNYPGYLYLRVIFELYHQRKVDKIVDFVDFKDFENYEWEENEQEDF